MEMALPRTSRICSSERASRSRPSNSSLPATMRPGGDAMSLRMESEVTLLPQPDSPTTASVSPTDTENETPSTARTTPSRVKKCVCKSSISSSGLGLAIGLHVASKAGIERIAHAVAQEIDRQDGQRQKNAGKEDQIVGKLKERTTLCHDVAPARDVERRTGPEKRQNGFGQHGGGTDVGALYQQRCDGVGQ